MNGKSWLAWLVVFLVAIPAALRGQEKAAAIGAAQKALGDAAERPKFIRLQRNDSKRAIAMETAVVRFAAESRPGVAVDLIGAVHVGDKAYYDELNKLFESYDVVLYELVAPEGTKVPKGGRKEGSAHPVGALQDGMSAMLELRHQLDCVDYTRANFKHADMSPDEFSKTMEQRGESFFQMFLRLMGQGMAQSASGASGTSDVALLFALFSKDRATKLKVAMAEQFDNLGGQLDAIDGPEGSTIISERNKKCFEVLGKQLEEGKKKIAIFYGAGHLPDMERRLVTDFGLKRESEKWLSAWRLEK